jgi:hypothetical protein
MADGTAPCGLARNGAQCASQPAGTGVPGPALSKCRGCLHQLPVQTSGSRPPSIPSRLPGPCFHTRLPGRRATPLAARFGDGELADPVWSYEVLADAPCCAHSDAVT